EAIARAIERWSMYRHILIPTDGSELAEHAVTNGLSLAKSVGAKVTVIIAQEPFDWLSVPETRASQRQALENLAKIRGHYVSGPHGVSSSFEFRACLSAGARPLYDGKNFERRGPYAHASNQSVRSPSFGTCGDCSFLRS